jgi:hypothetical protein
MSGDSILVSWKPPEQPNGIVSQYTVYVREDSAEAKDVSVLAHVSHVCQIILGGQFKKPVIKIYTFINKSTPFFIVLNPALLNFQRITYISLQGLLVSMWMVPYTYHHTSYISTGDAGSSGWWK